MKTKAAFIMLWAFLLLTLNVFSQAPQKFNYQAVVRDDAGTILEDQNVSIKISILQGAVDGTVVYSETHSPTTSSIGLVTLEIGGGTTSDDFTLIDWGSNIYFMKVEMDATGGTTYTEMGTSQILSVPYALHSKTAENTFSGDYLDLSNTPTNVSAFTNDAGYLTSFIETDPTIAQNFDFSSASEGNILRYDGNKFVTSTDVMILSTTEITALTPEAGQSVFNSTENLYLIYSGSGWISIPVNCWPDPTEAVAGPDQSIIIETTSTTLEANTPEAGHGTGQWSIVSGDGGSFDNINNPNAVFTGEECTDYTLQWEISTVCNQSTDNVNISFVTTPTTANAGDNIYSPEQTTVTLNANNPTIGTGAWSVVNGSGGSFTIPNSYNSNFTGNNNETYILRWTITTDCASSYDEVTVFIGNVIGQYRHGGVIFYVDETAEHGLVCALSDQSTGIIWGDNEVTGATGTAIGTGQANTSAVVTILGAGSYAAQVCNDLTLNGYSDWFLPSIDELDAMYQTRITIDSTSMANGGNAFAQDIYWSSSEFSSLYAGAITFSDDDPDIAKGNLYRVRAVRAF